MIILEPEFKIGRSYALVVHNTIFVVFDKSAVAHKEVFRRAERIEFQLPFSAFDRRIGKNSRAVGITTLVGAQRFEFCKRFDIKLQRQSFDSLDDVISLFVPRFGHTRISALAAALFHKISEKRYAENSVTRYFCVGFARLEKIGFQIVVVVSESVEYASARRMLCKAQQVVAEHSVSLAVGRELFFSYPLVAHILEHSERAVFVRVGAYAVYPRIAYFAPYYGQLVFYFPKLLSKIVHSTRYYLIALVLFLYLFKIFEYGFSVARSAVVRRVVKHKHFFERRMSYGTAVTALVDNDYLRAVALPHEYRRHFGHCRRAVDAYMQHLYAVLCK